MNLPLGNYAIVHREDKLYLTTVIDLLSRRLLGYAMGGRHDAELVVAALNTAAATRGGDVRGVIFHSDRAAANTPHGDSSGPAAGWASSSPWAAPTPASTTPRARRSSAS
ncbi:DDE-type integrase/transposase/recombinase [Streptomyces sp. TRM49041]|uniref:DDE-type integrase/transposase/recombinase n=1 Tax=Streptomyces sp. TRM49041 TaxID=2603216 RepID=UPI0037D9FFE2